MTIAPKDTFLNDANRVKAHGATIEALLSTRAHEVALLEMQVRMNSQHGNDAAANQYRLEGARTVLNILLSLNERPKIPSVPNHNLQTQ